MKRLTIFLFVLIVSGPLCAVMTETSTPTVSPTISQTPDCSNGSQRSWTFGSGTNGWDTGMNVTVSASGGNLVMTALAADPYVFGPSALCLQASEHFLNFVLWNQTPDTAVQFYFRDETVGFTEPFHVDIPVVPNDTGFRNYWFDLSTCPTWGTIIVYQIRFDPGKTISSGTMLMQSISISGVAPTSTVSPTCTMSPNESPTFSDTASASITPIESPTSSSSPTLTITQTPGVAATPTCTPISRKSPTETVSPNSVKPTLSPSMSPTAQAWSDSGRGLARPNPFFPGRPPLDKVIFYLPAIHGSVSLSILDLDFRVVWRGTFSENEQVQWDGRGSSGGRLGSGVYLWVLVEDGHALRKGSIVLAR